MQAFQKFFNYIVSRSIFVIAYILFCIIIAIASYFLLSKIYTRYFNDIQKTVLKTSNKLLKIDEDFIAKRKEVLIMPNIQKSKNLNENKKPVDETTSVFDTAYYYYLWNKYINEYGLSDLDSLTIDSIIKADMKKQASQQNKNESTGYTLKKDELLYVKLVNAEPLDTISKGNYNPAQYTIEFWVSPINYKGIKTIGNLIVIYGVFDYDSVKLKFDNNNELYIKIKDNLYKLIRDGNLYTLNQLKFKNS